MTNLNKILFISTLVSCFENFFSDKSFRHHLYKILDVKHRNELTSKLFKFIENLVHKCCNLNEDKTNIIANSFDEILSFLHKLAKKIKCTIFCNICEKEETIRKTSALCEIYISQKEENPEEIQVETEHPHKRYKRSSSTETIGYNTDNIE